MGKPSRRIREVTILWSRAMTVPKLRSPIVLVHGLFGFGRFEVAGTPVIDYFRGIPELMIAGGNRVFVPFLSPIGSIAERATQLRTFILTQSPHDPVHLVAHS